MITLKITLDETFEVTGRQCVRMILFHGTAEGPYFQGTILPGGVDTQKSVPEGMMLSARYMIDGTDSDGKPARMFIENEGVAAEGRELITHPRITTNSPALAWLETADLVGRIEGDGENRILITIRERN